MMKKEITSVYRHNLESVTETLAAVNKRNNFYSFGRLLLILGGSVLIFQAVRAELVWLVLLGFVSVLIGFMGLVYIQSRLLKKKAYYEALKSVNENEIAIAERKPNRYHNGSTYEDPKHSYRDDLDIFGDKSLYEMINRCATIPGKRRLADWLSAPATAAVIRERQEAVTELSEDLEWRQSLQAKLFFDVSQQTPIASLVHFMKGDGDISFGNRALRLYVKIAPFLVVGLFLLSAYHSLFLQLGIGLAMIHLLAALVMAGAVSRIGAKMDKAGRTLTAFSSVIAHLESRVYSSSLKKRLSTVLKSGDQGTSTSAVVKELGELLDKLDYRLNMVVGALLNMVFLWDFKQVFAILDWRAKHRGSVAESFDVIADFEVLNSLAILKANKPDWSFPEIATEGSHILEAKDLSHPLIHPDTAIANTYTLEGHRVALITGSNMAGKSTFLRTTGVNIVLALCGAPVHARQMTVSVMRVITYMRIKDSLNESTSTFKAELDRMQMILNTVKTQPDTFFLIDEMLRGTNSVDKYRGSKAIIQQLIADNGVGMVATHDLQLSQLEAAYPNLVKNFHFDIQVREGEMLFDYKLKDGECKIFNASMLLKNIGVQVEEGSN